MEPKNKSESQKLFDLEKNAKRKRFIKELLIINLIVLIGVFAKYIPFINNNENLMNVLNRTLGKFFDIGSLIADNALRILETATIVVFVWVLNKLTTYVLNILIRNKIRESINILIRSALKYFIYFLGFIFILGAWGVDPTTILASLGLLGFSISIGAQGIIEDFFSGLFLLFENQFKIGDVVYIDGFRGQVYKMGLRTTSFIDEENLDVKIIKNKDVKNLINASTRPSFSICDVSIEYEEDLEKIEKIAQPFFDNLLKLYPDYIYERPVYLGVQSLGDSAVVIRFAAKTIEEKKLQLNRILNQEIKLLFDKNKISFPYKQLVVHTKK